MARFAPVSVLVIVMAECGKSAPEGAVTNPLTEESDWASSDKAEINERRITAIVFIDLCKFLPHKLRGL